MHKSSAFVLIASVLGAIPTNAQNVDPLKPYTIKAANIEATFIPYGARLTSLLVPDRSGKLQDVIFGYDDPKQYINDTLTDHTYTGSVLGPYANRIKNGTYELDGVTYEVPKNDNGVQALHSGDLGYDQRNWTVTAQTEDSITFTFHDTESEGFPGQVLTHATYSVNSSYVEGNENPQVQLTTKTVSVSLNKRTPIMLSNHMYWNLNAWKVATVVDDATLHLPLSGRFVKVDEVSAPTGELGDVEADLDGSLDFRTAKPVSQDFNNTGPMCGGECNGYDHCFLVDRPEGSADWSSSPETLTHILTVDSAKTGISMKVSANQKAVQVYTCNWMGGNIAVKQSQIDRNIEDGDGGVEFIQKYGCIAIEPQGWIDGLNNPEWGQLPYQTFSSHDGPAVNWATYVFGTNE